MIYAFHDVWEESFWLNMVKNECVCVCFARHKKINEFKSSSKKVTFQLSGDEDSEGEDIEDIFGGKSQLQAQSESKSSFEKRQEKVNRLNVMLQH